VWVGPDDRGVVLEVIVVDLRDSLHLPGNWVLGDTSLTRARVRQTASDRPADQSHETMCPNCVLKIGRSAVRPRPWPPWIKP